VPDEVRSRLHERLEPNRLVLEVDALDVRAGREAAPVRDDELEALRERPLGRPGGLAVDDAAVDEEDAGAGDPGILGTDTK
jgi:hypothetical protein